MQESRCTEFAELVVYRVDWHGVPAEVAEDIVGGPVPHLAERDGPIDPLAAPPCRARWPAVCDRPVAWVGQQPAQSVAMEAASALSSMMRRPRDSWARIPQSSPPP